MRTFEKVVETAHSEDKVWQREVFLHFYETTEQYHTYIQERHQQVLCLPVIVQSNCLKYHFIFHFTISLYRVSFKFQYT